MKLIEQALSKDNLQEAARHCEAILSENEYDVVGLYYKGIVNRKLKNYQLALESQNTLINLLPENPEYYAERGLTYHMLKEQQGAINDFNQAVELDPDNPYRYSSRAFIRDFYGDPHGAIEDYQKAIELDPEDAIALNNLGIIEEKLGRMEQAKEKFERSDKITGVDQQLKDIAQNSPATFEHHHEDEEAEKTTSGWRNFMKTLGSLFSSPKERQDFFKFLVGKK